MPVWYVRCVSGCCSLLPPCLSCEETKATCVWKELVSLIWYHTGFSQAECSCHWASEVFLRVPAPTQVQNPSGEPTVCSGASLFRSCRSHESAPSALRRHSAPLPRFAQLLIMSVLLSPDDIYSSSKSFTGTISRPGKSHRLSTVKNALCFRLFCVGSGEKLYWDFWNSEPQVDGVVILVQVYTSTRAKHQQIWLFTIPYFTEFDKQFHVLFFTLISLNVHFF